jgi:hypothetical protein
MEQQKESEQREFFRINDMVALRAELLSSEDIDKRDALYEIRWRDSGFTSETNYHREEHLPAFTQIERKFPEVAIYLSHLEEEIEKLHSLLVSDDDRLANKATHQVNLSAGGLRFMSEVEFTQGSSIELSIRLFPSRTIVFVYAQVVRCDAADTGADKTWAIATEFTHVHEADQDALIKHIHKWQMSRLRVKSD